MAGGIFDELSVFEFCSPLGFLRIQGTARYIVRISFSGLEGGGGQSLEVPSLLRECARQLGEYFQGSRRQFSLPLHFGLASTLFQREVWRKLTEIPFGQTRSYQEVAEKVGDVRRARAVGQAVGRNPLPVLVPCHRVVRKDGGVGGYSSGIDKKIWLLRYEASVLGGR